MAQDDLSSSNVWELSQDQWSTIQPLLAASAPPAPKGRQSGRKVGSVVIVKDPFYIVATSPQAVENSRVLKHGDTFSVFDHYGDIKPGALGEEGLYHEGTRFLSSLILTLGHDRPLLLSSTVREDNALFTADLTNADVRAGDELKLARGLLHLARNRFLWQGVCYERLTLRNYSDSPINVLLSFHFEADFCDIFEVRGTKRDRRGRLLPPDVQPGRVMLSYEGLDQVMRRTRLNFSPAPQILTPSEARFDLSIAPKGHSEILILVACQVADTQPPQLSFDSAFQAADKSLKESRGHACDIYTSNEQFNDWLHRSTADLAMMVTETPYGPYPYAGVPWFSTPFGRDGIITALEYLWVAPTIAQGVLNFLANTQAMELNAEQDAEPGKILHEMRTGEMAALGEVPFGRYYGSIDSTPLFVMLAAAYYQRTADKNFIASIWPNIDAALRWIERYGDRDGDGFVEYFRRSPTGLAQQGWKDSQDSVFHADGTSAEGPIALCEVQGYAYAARQGAAQLAQLLGMNDRAAELSRQAETLREKFENTFWCDELSTYVLALDGQKLPCRVRSSNAAHCLFSGIASSERAAMVGRTLLDDASFSGWGIRTIATTEARYNPMSYHNGSVWPHDNALAASGLARYGQKQAAGRILSGMFDASLFVDLHRMPELFCGFPRRRGEGPTLYPVACAPQSWAAATVFMLLEACLGLRIDAPQKQITFAHPFLPPSLQRVQIRNLCVADARVDLVLQRHLHDVSVNVVHREGEIGVMVLT